MLDTPEKPPTREVLKRRVLALLKADSEETGYARGGKVLHEAYAREHGSNLENDAGGKNKLIGIVQSLRTKHGLQAPPRGMRGNIPDGSAPQVPSGKYSRTRATDRINHGGLNLLKGNNPALVENRTIFQSTVRQAFGSKDRVLKSGDNSCKTGRRVTKGRWKDFPIFTLTLEERATCPLGCHMRRGCMGNNMHLAHRFRHGKFLEARLEKELRELDERFPDGFVVRVHILGDFYSPEYVDKWDEWLGKFRALHVFGYTNWQPYQTEFDDDVIGKKLLALREKRWKHFAIRFSRPVAEDNKRESITVASTADVPATGILCPLTDGKTDSCGSCTLCWETNKNIYFLHHGSKKSRLQKPETDA